MTLLIFRQNRRTEANIIIQNYKKNKITVEENENELLIKDGTNHENKENYIFLLKKEKYNNKNNKEIQKHINNDRKIYEINLCFFNEDLLNYFLMDFEKYSEDIIKIKIVNKKNEEIEEIVLNDRRYLYFIKKEDFEELFMIIDSFTGVINIKILGKV